MQTLFLEEATCHLKKLGCMKNNMALRVPSWKSSSLTWGLLTVCLHTDFILDKEVGKGRDPIKGGQNCTGEQWQKHSLWRKIKSHWKGKLNCMEDNWSFLDSSVYCTVGGHQDSVTVITTVLEWRFSLGTKGSCWSSRGRLIWIGALSTAGHYPLLIPRTCVKRLCIALPVCYQCKCWKRPEIHWTSIFQSVVHKMLISVSR